MCRNSIYLFFVKLNYVLICVCVLHNQNTLKFMDMRLQNIRKVREIILFYVGEVLSLNKTHPLMLDRRLELYPFLSSDNE